MNTNRTNRTIAIVIAIIVLFLSQIACGTGTEVTQQVNSAARLAADAPNQVSLAANALNLSLRPGRTANCTVSESQLIYNALNAQINPELGYVPNTSIDQWLNANQSNFPCISR